MQHTMRRSCITQPAHCNIISLTTLHIDVQLWLHSSPVQAARVPQKWFAHFYAVGVLCAVLALAVLISGELPIEHGLEGGQALLGMLCLLFHLSRRLMESLCLMSYPEDAYMHLIAYFFGLR